MAIKGWQVPAGFNSGLFELQKNRLMLEVDILIECTQAQYQYPQ